MRLRQELGDGVPVEHLDVSPVPGAHPVLERMPHGGLHVCLAVGDDEGHRRPLGHHGRDVVRELGCYALLLQGAAEADAVRVMDSHLPAQRLNLARQLGPVGLEIASLITAPGYRARRWKDVQADSHPG